ncbi:hypothetical protein AWN76_002565 [Rhodothermaceae bacterium RA]|nr:hypothetical protein AWN76_002565 [Rhodothermaceae bacterium RA]
MAEDDRSIPATQFPQEPSFDLRFPPLPSTIAEVSRLLTQDSGEPDVQRLADIVNADLVVAASVLRRVNSAYYGLRRRIGDVRQAVFLLGYLEVCNIVLTAGMMKLREVVNTDEQATIFDQILCRSIGAAYYTRKLATLLDLAQASSAFTIGLLQPIGRLVLLYNRPDDYEALWFNGGACLPPSVEQERSIFGTDYTAVGAMALEEWQLPQAYCDVLRHYSSQVASKNLPGAPSPWLFPWAWPPRSSCACPPHPCVPPPSSRDRRYPPSCARPAQSSPQRR